MQIISLNILGGAFYEPLKDFLKQEAALTDFFCFQEVYSSKSSTTFEANARSNIMDELRALLPDFECYFEIVDNDFPIAGIVAGMVIFVRKGIPIKSSGKFFVHGAKSHNPAELEIPGYVQYIRLDSLTVAHYHGLVWPGSKLDTPDRLDQSRKINEFLARETGQKILCGDFNLDRDTESVSLIEQGGMRNLIKEFHILTTRSEINYARYPAHDRQYFADYAFVSPEVKVTSFEVPIVNVSDHLPLKLQFES